MPVLDIGGRRVQVDDGFMKLSPDEQNATVDEIASSFKSQAPTERLRVTPADQPQQFADGSSSQQSSVTDDVLKSAAAGVGKGIAGIGGALGSVSDMGARGIGHATNYIERNLGLPETPQYDPSKTILSKIPNVDDVQGAIESVTGKFHEPETRAGRYASAMGEAIPGVLMGPGGLVGKVASVVGSGAGSEAAGELAHGSKYEGLARLGGAFAGGLAPAFSGRTITPLPATSARQAMVDNLASEGVTSLTAGQRTGNKALQYLEDASSSSPMAGGGAEKIRAEGQRQFSETALKRAGAGPDASPEVLSKNRDRLGSEFERLSTKNTLLPDNQMVMDIVGAVKRYRNVPESQQKAILQGYIDDIMPHVNAGAMPGVEYQPMRSMLSADAKAVKNSDPYLSKALAGIRDALDNAMSRSIAPDDRKAWYTARQQWGAQRILEKVASRAGEATAEGQVVPANLRNAVAAADNSAYATGKGDFAQLARSGSAVMAPLPNSGTAQRHNAFNLLNQATAGVIPAVSGRVLMSKPVQDYLANQALAKPLRNSRFAERALINALSEAPRALTAPPREKPR
jgi:hypothetical protein